MLNKVWSYNENSIVLELVGRFSLASYVQVHHRASNLLAERQGNKLDVIIDFRALNTVPGGSIPIEPLENVVYHPQRGRLIFVLPYQDPSNVAFLWCLAACVDLSDAEFVTCLSDVDNSELVHAS